VREGEVFKCCIRISNKSQHAHEILFERGSYVSARC